MLGIDIVGGMKKIFNKIVGDEREEKDEEQASCISGVFAISSWMPR